MKFYYSCADVPYCSWRFWAAYNFEFFSLERRPEAGF